MENYWLPIEKQWLAQHASELDEAQRVCSLVHEFVAWLATHAEFAKRPPSAAVTVQRLLVRRLGEELRAVEVLAIHGHGFQAISAAANLFEQAHFLTYAASNDVNAEKYLNANNMSKSIASVKEVVEEAGAQYGWDRARIDQEYGKYRFLCAFKHNNAMTHRLLRFPKDTDFVLGQLAVADSLWLVLSSLGMLAMWAFPMQSLNDVMNKCNSLMAAVSGLYPELQLIDVGSQDAAVS